MNEKNRPIEIFNIQQVLEQTRDYNPKNDLDENQKNSLSSEENLRLESLTRLLSADNQQWREKLVIDPVTLRNLNSFLNETPNFETANEIIKASASLSNFATSQIKIPPLLLLGEPGVGKTRFTTALSRIFNSKHIPIAVNTMTDAMDITGSTVSWKGARPSRLTKALVAGTNASPTIIFDELDKYSPSGSEKPSRLYDILHSLLEEENSSRFMDEYYNVEFNLSNAIFIATANDTSMLPESLLDRFNVVKIRNHTQKEKRVILRSIFNKFLTENNNSFHSVDDEVLDLISTQRVRLSQKIINLAMGLAAIDHTKTITKNHIQKAISILKNEESRPQIGFLSR